MLIIGGTLLSISMLMLALSLDRDMPTPAGWDALIDRERQNARSRNRF